MNSMAYNGCTARMDFDADDKIIVGRVIEIDNVFTFHGKSMAEFEAAFKTAVDGYIHACEQLGQTAEKPASGRLMLRVSPANVAMPRVLRQGNRCWRICLRQ